MKKTIVIFQILLCFLFFHISLFSQTNNKIENIIIVTTDGFRWQEVFNGMDSAIANNSKYNQGDSALIFKKYWAETAQKRREKLLPFIWDTIASKGQIYGNRAMECKVNVANPYWFSYPGYSEIFCGYVDTLINSNKYPPNPNTNVLEFLNKQTNFKGKVAAFGAWEAFNRILNKKRSGLPIVCGKDSCGGANPDAEQQIINMMKKDSYNPFGNTEDLDVFTQYQAMDYLKKVKPRVLYISYGETDEWAHEGHYEDYLDAANMVDKWLNDIWNFIQSSPTYKDKTLLFISVDHGRGSKENNSLWTSHNSKVAGSNQTWFAVIGPSIVAKGEIKNDIQLYEKQYAQTLAQLLGLSFSCEHPVSNGFKETLIK